MHAEMLARQVWRKQVMTNDKQLRRALDLLQLKLEKLEVNDAVSLINKENTETENQRKKWFSDPMYRPSPKQNIDNLKEYISL